MTSVVNQDNFQQVPMVSRIFTFKNLRSINSALPTSILFRRPLTSLVDASNSNTEITEAESKDFVPFPRSVLKISDLKPAHIANVLEYAVTMKEKPHIFQNAMQHRTLLMLFEKPSLRTRVSFEVGMTQMGGHAIFYSVADSPLGKKESISDTAKVLSRYVDVIMARVNKRSDIRELAENSTIPVINGLDDFAHPCQILADMMTIGEKKGRLHSLKVAYVGDCHNNVTYDLMRAAHLVGYDISIAGPSEPDFQPEMEVLEECKALFNENQIGSVTVCKTAEEAIKNADVVYADSWMSYGIAGDKLQQRIAKLMPFQVTSQLMATAKEDAIFMNCLPAMRGQEQTAEVVDGPDRKSVV